MHRDVAVPAFSLDSFDAVDGKISKYSLRGWRRECGVPHLDQCGIIAMMEMMEMMEA